MRARPCDDTINGVALLLLALSQTSFGTSVTTSTTRSPTTSAIANSSTCPARSINYITQTLPQQCLTSSWASKASSLHNITLASTSSIDALATFIAASGSVSISTTGSEPGLTEVESPNSTDGSTRESSKPEVPPKTTRPEPSKQESKQETLAEDPSQESEPDSPLDNANFLSFEEWKHQNLAKAGQSAENLRPREGSSGPEHRRRPGGMNNGLESLGEDSEIDIDFSGFVSPGGMNDALSMQSALPMTSQPPDERQDEARLEDLSNPHRRSMDAGKTCKERSNYASFDCAATILKANSECKGSTSVLVESKDSYLLNVCSAKNKFLIVELCDDILIDTIALANFEYFSSMFRTFRVSVSDRYPVKMDKWKELGIFEARNSREIQAFLVENPLIWARYLRVEFLTHYGNEYYCPVSLLRVHGTTMLEEFNHEVKGSRGEDDSESNPGEIEEEAPARVSNLVSTNALETTAQVDPEPIEETAPSTQASTTPIPVEGTVDLPQETASSDPNNNPSGNFTPYESSIAKGLEDVLSCRVDREDRCSHVRQSKEATPASTALAATADQPAASIGNVHEISTNETTAVAPQTTSPSEDTAGVTQSHPSSHSPSPSLVSNHNNSVLAVSTSNDTSTSSDQVNSPSTQSPDIMLTSASSAKVSSSSVQPSAVDVMSKSSVKVQASATQPPAANPSTQESFFKSVHKRLQQLEANSTLSLQYIEEQSRILRDAFSKVEKRQLSKTSSFLETLNTTVLTELRDFRMQYDQIWQSTVLELSSQREQSAHEVSALSVRMTFLADEIVFQKRIAMVQFMLILLCLGLVIFSRHGGTNNYLEIPPLVQNAINKSSANLSNLSRYTHFETPPGSPSSTRPPSTGLSSRYGLFGRKKHQRNPSDESDVNGGVHRPAIAYSPPTPESQVSRGDRNTSPSDRDASPSTDDLEDLTMSSPVADENDFRETKSSPATPDGMREEHREELLPGPVLTPKPHVVGKDPERPGDDGRLLTLPM